MPRFLLALTVTLTALTFALALTARAWGETQPPHPALRGFVEGCEGKPQPCWFGIVPRLVTVDEAKPILTSYGWDLPEFAFAENPGGFIRILLISKGQIFPCTAEAFVVDHQPKPVIMEIAIYDCSIKLGDFVSMFPDDLRLGHAFGDSILFQDWNLTAYYRGNLNPYTPVERLVVAEYERFGAETAYDWKGFMTLVRICRLYPFSEACSM